MRMPGHTPPLTPSTAFEDIYTFGYSPAAIQMLAGRTAEEQARFFLPYVRPGMSLLDCGCGPGSITVGLAAADRFPRVLQPNIALPCESKFGPVSVAARSTSASYDFVDL